MREIYRMKMVPLTKTCNRCNYVHNEIGICPMCRCPEYRLSEGVFEGTCQPEEKEKAAVWRDEQAMLF